MSAYYIFQENLHDPAKFDAYRKVIMSTLAPFEGRIVTRSGEFTVVEGEWPFDRTVILEFPSRTAALAWYNSPAYQVILPLRRQSMMCNAVLIDGVE